MSTPIKNFEACPPVTDSGLSPSIKNFEGRPESVQGDRSPIQARVPLGTDDKRYLDLDSVSVWSGMEPQMTVY